MIWCHERLENTKSCMVQGKHPGHYMHAACMTKTFVHSVHGVNVGVGTKRWRYIF